MRVLLLTLAFAVTPVAAMPDSYGPSRIQIHGLDPMPEPVPAPPRPLNLRPLKAKPAAKKAQYKANPPSFQSNIRFGFRRPAGSSIRYGLTQRNRGGIGYGRRQK